MTRVGLLDAEGRSSATLLARIRTVLRTDDVPAVDGAPTWLDTFDARLFHARLGVAFLVSAASGWLQVTDVDSGEVLGRLPVATRPRFVTDLPAHRLTTRIASIIDIRALIPFGTSPSSTRRLRVLDAIDKTIAYIDLEPDGAPHPVTVVAVRGYDKAAAAVVNQLCNSLGLSPDATDPAVPPFGAPGWSGQRAPESGPVPLDRDQPAGEGLAAILRRLHRVVEANVGGTVEAIDTEFLHDLRVAVRRARSALKIAGDLLPESVSGRLAQGLSLVGDATTPARDLDVYLLGFTELTNRLCPQVASNLAEFRDLLLVRQAKAHHDLSSYLRSRTFATFLNRWADLVDETFPPTPTAAGRRPLGEVADERVRRTGIRLLKLGHRITDDSPIEDLHDLRKRSKELRYALEMFRPLYPAKPVGRVIGELKSLQDNLGVLHDSHFQHTAVAGFAADLAAAGARVDTIVAMGALMQDLASREASARQDFRATFDRFARRANTSRMTALVGGKP